MEDRTFTIIKALLLLIFVFTTILSEKFYNQYLFNFTLNEIPSVQRNLPDFLKYFFVIVTFSCYLQFIIPVLLIIFNFCSLQNTYILFNVLFTSTFADNFAKMIYKDPRPFWVDSEIKFWKCEIDFGNPSGHAVCSFSFYLMIFHLIYDNFHKNKSIIFKIMYWVGVLSLLISVLISRVILGAHSFNQVLYGALVGLVVYFLFYHLIGMQEWKHEDFLACFQSGHWFSFFFILKYLALVVKAVFLYYFHHYDNKVWEKNLRSICPEKPEFVKFQHLDFGLCLLVSACIGMQVGILITMQVLGLRNTNVDIARLEMFNNWHNTTFVKKLLRIIFCIVFFFGNLDTLKFYSFEIC